MSKEAAPAALPRNGPWFTLRPRAAVLVSGVLYAAVLGLQFTIHDPRVAIFMLYLFPVSLAAMARGRSAGLLAGLVAVGLVAVWTVTASVSLDELGWLSRVVPLLLVGFLIGDARERLEKAADDRAAYRLAVERHLEAVEINDSLVQGMAAAKWALEAGQAQHGLQVLDETVQLGHRLVSNLIRDANSGTGNGPDQPGAIDKPGQN